MSEENFDPDATCIRAHIVTFLWRYSGKPSVTVENKFSDVDMNAYYADAVNWAVKNEITRGISETSFAPDNTCTRGQIVLFLYRAFGVKKA